MITRRDWLGAAAAVAAATTARLKAQPATITLTVPEHATGPHMPMEFVGLSYEVQQLTDPSFFSPANAGLIAQFKRLAPHGVLRLGGNTSEFAWWKPLADTPEPSHPPTRVVEGEPKAQYYPVTPEAVRNLAGFLKATGWTCLYGIGMGTNTPERAADEAEFVAKTLGNQLQYFQVGNEPDLFSRHLRDPKTWSPKTYLAEWLGLAQAITKRVPSAKFGLPDVAASIDWLPQIAELWQAVTDPPTVTTLTHHYYFGGPATNPDVNLPNLLSPSTSSKVQHTADIAKTAAAKMKARVRMTEGNTCYRGGKPGVSDVFGAAIWAADYALELAHNNYSGINLHGGTGQSVANSVGGFLPGDVMLKQQGATPEQIATHPHPFYTPIGTFGSEYRLQPVGVGMEFAGLLSGANLFDVDLTSALQATGVNATAYAAQFQDGSRALVILNKDLGKDLEVLVEFTGSVSRDRLQQTALQAPQIESREAEIRVGSSSPKLEKGRAAITVPKASGLLLKLVR